MPKQLRLRLRARVTLTLFAAIAPFPPPGYGDDTQSAARSGLEPTPRVVREVEVATEVQTLHEDADIWGLDFSPDGKLLATAAPDSLAIHLWDWRARRVVRTFERPRGGNLTVKEKIRFSPDGRLLASCSGPSGPNNSVIRVWNAENGEIFHDIEDHNNGDCKAITFAPDGVHLIRIAGRFRHNPQDDDLIVYDTTVPTLFE